MTRSPAKIPTSSAGPASLDGLSPLSAGDEGTSQAPLRREEVSLVETAYHQILLRIIRGELPGGTKISTSALSRETGISRTPITQALGRLAADGIVISELNKRVRVRPGAENWLVDIHQMRILLEPAAAGRAAQTLPPDTLQRLRTLAEAARPYQSDYWATAAQQFDYALHLAIADHCHNLPLGEAIRKCWSYKRLSYEAGQDKPEALEQGYQEHLAILAALESRDSATASAAVLFHLHSAANLRPQRRIV